MIEPAYSLMDYMAVRKIRNKNCQWLTGNPNKIGIFKQLWFYLFKPKGIDLYVCKDDEKVKGYLLIRRSTHTAFITEVIDDPYRGQGIGSTMIHFAQYWYSHLTADILVNNVPSIRLHESCGFKLKEMTSTKMIFTWERA